MFLGKTIFLGGRDMDARMKFTIIVVVGLFFSVFFYSTTMGQDMKIGFVNSAEIFTKYKSFADVQQKFNKEVAEWQEKTQAFKNEVDSLAAFIKGEINVIPPRLPFHALSDIKQQEKQEEYRAKEAAYLEYVNTIFGPDGTAERRNAELTQPMLDKINSVISKIAQEEDYAYVFDAVGGAIAYGDPKYDLTEAVIEELNKEVE